MPKLLVIGGPNGAGKSTVAPRILECGFDNRLTFVNADQIARGLSESHPESVTVQAGAIMLRRLDELAASQADFTFETTLSTRSFASRIRRLQNVGYHFQLIYL